MGERVRANGTDECERVGEKRESEWERVRER